MKKYRFNQIDPEAKGRGVFQTHLQRCLAIGYTLAVFCKPLGKQNIGGG